MMIGDIGNLMPKRRPGTLIDPYMEHSKVVYIYVRFWRRLGAQGRYRGLSLTDFKETHPIVVKAKGACPFEDCGWLQGYYHILEAVGRSVS